MNPNKVLWEKGDFTQVAALMRTFGEAFANSLGVEPSLRVLDLGCGDGTTALPLARLGADVIGIDIATNLVDAGRRRAAQAGLTRLTFQEGDACDLHGVEDASFDLTVSVFGAMFGPRPLDVAREMVRVTKPGGRIVMGTWIPDDPTFVSQMFKMLASFSPPPPEGFVSPMMWGMHPHVIERFAAAGIPAERISMRREIFHLTAAGVIPFGLVDIYRTHFGPAMNAFQAADEDGTADMLHRQLLELAENNNTAGEGSSSIPAAFLRVEVRV